MHTGGAVLEPPPHTFALASQNVSGMPVADLDAYIDTVLASPLLLSLLILSVLSGLAYDIAYDVGTFGYLFRGLESSKYKVVSE